MKWVFSFDCDPTCYLITFLEGKSGRRSALLFLCYGQRTRAGRYIKIYRDRQVFLLLPLPGRMDDVRGH